MIPTEHELMKGTAQMTRNNKNNNTRLAILSLIALIFPASLPANNVATAQDLRYELGARLRLFEYDFERLESNEQQALALEKLSSSVQLFFGMQLKKAAEELDGARLAIQAESVQPVLEKTKNLRLVTPGRLIDLASGPLTCRVETLYAAASFDGLRGLWRLLPWDSRDPQSALTSGQINFPSPPVDGDPVMVQWDIDTADLNAGDYVVELSVVVESSEKEEVHQLKQVVIARRGLSLATQPEQRIAALAETARTLQKSGNPTQLATFKGNVKQLERIFEGAALETDFPSARLLDETEQALQHLLQNEPAYGAGRPGEFWILAATGSGEKWLRLQAPPNAQNQEPLPLVIALHGAGGSENMFFDGYGDGKIRRLASQRGWLLAAPRLGFGFGGLKLDELVDEINRLYPVDREAVFLVGHSMGAGAAVAMTAGSVNKPTAVAALGGGRGVADAQPFEGVPFFIAAGSHDFGRSGALQLSRTLEAGGIDVEYRDYANIEHLAIVQVALPDVFSFFDNHAVKHQQPDAASISPGVRINQLQLVGTHNSYHLAPDSVAMKTIAAVVPREAEAIDNSQRPLTEQFEQLGVRHVELDLFLDPEGKLFSQPFAYVQAQRQGADVPQFDPDQKMSQPGIKILHSPDFDYRTTVYTLMDALSEIKDWSDQNPTHVPIFILLELKSDSFSPMTRPLAWTAQSFEELEKEILSVLPRQRILTPDDVRGSAATLREAVEGLGWPIVDEHRGKVAFLLDNEGGIRDLYLTRSPILEGCLLFASVARTHPAAAWMKRNDPVRAFDEISELVKAGFMIRTRADSGTVESRRNDTRRRDLAIESGAQLISTDFPEADLRFSDYHFQLPLPPE